ncbi:MAG: DUF2634 domain-containing protein [Peptococcaceae bacterium]|nr:DUF2634 domain-containing protein [Peptococcaceae bacterium]
MLPVQEVELIEDFTITTQPGKTYILNLAEYRIEPGRVDGVDALKQAIYKMLMTERYRYPIYSWNYGIELEELIGKPMSYVRPELERRIREALLVDDRIKEVDTFTFSEADKNSLEVTFIVHSIYGDIEVVKEVNAA